MSLLSDKQHCFVTMYITDTTIISSDYFKNFKTDMCESIK